MMYQPIVDDVLLRSTDFVRVVDDVTIASVKLSVINHWHFDKFLIDNAIDLFLSSAIVNHAGLGGTFRLGVKRGCIECRLHGFGN